MKTLALALALLGSFALAACGDKGGDKPADKTAGGSGGAKPAPTGTGYATPTVAPTPAPAPSVASPAGTWAVDVAAVWEANKAFFIQMAKAGAGEGAAWSDEMAAAIEKQVKSMVFTVDVKADHTWTSKRVMGPETEEEKGTWSLAGDQLTIVDTTEEGASKTHMMTFSGDTISGKPEEGGPTITLRRK